MCTSFTEHVRDFGPACDPAGCVLPRLEKLLRQRMRRRNLLSAPPSYLGYTDVSSWDALGAFEDILIDCYLFAIPRRLQGLRNQLRVKPNIDGLIARNVDNFLLERQRQNDPIGYAVFGNVEGSAAEMVATGEITAEGTVGGRLHNSSVLRLRPTDPQGEAADPEKLRQALVEAPGWDENLADLTYTTEEGQYWIGKFLRRLGQEGISTVRIADLVSVLAVRARGEWASRHAVPSSELGLEGDDDFGAVVRLVWPDVRTVEQDQWDKLKRLVPERIGGLERQQRVRDRLLVVFQELVRLAEAGDHAPPTQADLVRKLELPRETVSADFRLLREVISGILPKNTDG